MTENLGIAIDYSEIKLFIIHRKADNVIKLTEIFVKEVMAVRRYVI